MAIASDRKRMPMFVFGQGRQPNLAGETQCHTTFGIDETVCHKNEISIETFKTVVFFGTIQPLLDVFYSANSLSVWLLLRSTETESC